MPVESPPILPFSHFKWKWASVQPTESLNRPDLFLGVLRALAKNEGRAKSDPQFIEDLREVQAEIGIPDGPNLARTPHRNIIRNSGQYWKVLGVLGPQKPITLTPLGRLYASREINSHEFAIHAVVNHTLPSSVYSDDEILDWTAAGIELKPLLLILQVIAALGAQSPAQANLSEGELANLVQPLSAVTQDPVRIATAIADYRSGALSVVNWPRTTTQDNDRRVSDEFLKFLWRHDLLASPTGPAGDERYALTALVPSEISALQAIAAGMLNGSSGIESQVESITAAVERRRVSRMMLDRPGQRQFRKDVLNASNATCFLTGTSVPQVLEAAHIKPVASQGSDTVGNGLCLRSDIHILFDANRIRLRPDGVVSYSSELLSDPQYSYLPKQIPLPTYANADAVEWRWAFY